MVGNLGAVADDDGARVRDRLMRAAIVFAAAALAIATAACERVIDRVAQRTGSGFDAEGTVHAFLWARNEGHDTTRFWHAAMPHQTGPPDPIDGRPIFWRSVPPAPPAHQKLPNTSWERFAVITRDRDGHEQERVWDFCLVPVSPRGEVQYDLLEIWPGGTDTLARCGAALESERYRGLREPTQR